MLLWCSLQACAIFQLFQFKLEISAGFVIVNVVQLQVQQAVLLEKALPLTERNSTYGLWNCTNKLNVGKCMEVSSGKD